MKIIKFSLILGLSLAKIRRRSRLHHRQHHTNLHESQKSSLSILHRDQQRLITTLRNSRLPPRRRHITSPQGRTLSFGLSYHTEHFTSHIHTIYFSYNFTQCARVPTPMNTFLKLNQSPFRVAAFNYAKRSISTTKMVQIKVSTSSYCIILALCVWKNRMF